MLDRLSTLLLECRTEAELGARLLPLVMEMVPVDTAVMRIRDGSTLRSVAALGLEEEVTTGFVAPIPEQGTGALVTLEALTAPDRSDFILRKGIALLHRLLLLDQNRVMGVLCLGTSKARLFSDEENRFLERVGRLTGSALVRLEGERALRRGITARDQLLAAVAHDLRNPLGVITIAANGILQRYAEYAVRRPVERILHGVHRADRMIRDLLDVYAAESGQLTVQKQPVDTAALVLAAVESQQNLAANASVIIASDLSPDAPSVEGEEERLVEVLENLVGNAVKFTPRGGTVTVGAAGDDHRALFWVKDTGCGVEPEQLPYLFDRFWQATKSDRRGTGLGLTICKAVVEAHGGRIWAESTLGVGTTLFFTIPAVANRGPAVVDVDTANILLVDDRPENVVSLKAILTRPDYRFLTANSGEEALRLALRETVDLALIDVAMPVMNGLEVAHHLKTLERSRHIPIIFVTAYGDDPNEIHRAYAAGAADYLVKPLDADIVRKKVAVLIDLARRRHGQTPPGLITAIPGVPE